MARRPDRRRCRISDGRRMMAITTIGIIGGGQLGRMLAIAAARLNFRTVILDPEADCPAAQVASQQITAAYDEPDALDAPAHAAQVVTYEFENVPVAEAGGLQQRKERR